MKAGRRLVSLGIVLVLWSWVPGPRPAQATQKFGPIELSGNLQSQNLIRHPDKDTFQYIQNRNVARLRLEYSWLEAGRFMSNYDIPFIQTSPTL